MQDPSAWVILAFLCLLEVLLFYGCSVTVVRRWEKKFTEIIKILCRKKLVDIGLAYYRTWHSDASLCSLHISAFGLAVSRMPL